MSLDESTYLKRFAQLELGPEHFDHIGHLYMAWLHLKHYDLEEASERVCSGIRGLADKFGVPEKFNHTLSEALMRIMAARLEKEMTLDAFLHANPDLANDCKGLLARYYSDECLLSEKARVGWVKPDRKPIQ